MRSARQLLILMTSPAQRLILVILSGIGPILATSSLFFGWFALPRYSDRWESLTPAIILVSSARYFAVNEEEELRIAVLNSDVISRNLTLRLDESNSSPVFISQNGTNVIWSGPIQSHEQIERSVKVYIPFDFSRGLASNTLNMKLDLTIWGGFLYEPLQMIGKLPLKTAPLPWHRRLFISSLSLLTLVGGWAAKEWWDIWKEILIGS